MLDNLDAIEREPKRIDTKDIFRTYILISDWDTNSLESQCWSNSRHVFHSELYFDFVFIECVVIGRSKNLYLRLFFSLLQSNNGFRAICLR